MHTILTLHLHCLKLQPDGPEGQYLCRMTNAQAFCGPSGRYINSFLTRYRPSGPGYNLVLEKSYKDIGPLGHGVKTWIYVNEVLELCAYRRLKNTSRGAGASVGVWLQSTTITPYVC